MLIWNRLLIATFALSVNFTYQVNAMENAKDVDEFSTDDSFSALIGVRLFNNNQAHQMSKDFLQAVYDQNNEAVQNFMCAPALQYLEENFNASLNEINAIVLWAKQNNYNALIKSIFVAILLNSK